MRSKLRRIAVVDSLHCGSIYGLHPPNFVTAAGAKIPQNPGQKHLWNCWTDWWAFALESPLDAIVVLGDVIDGKQYKQRGAEKNLALVEEQVQAARACLEPFTKGTKLYIVQGTEYHDGTAAHAVEELAMQLKAASYPGAGVGYRSHEVLDLKVDGVVINFAHHAPGVVGLYRATGADKEGIFSALAGKEGKAIKAHVLVRGHWHFYIHVEHASKHVVYVPCWQLQTRFMRRSSVYRMLPDIGGVLIEVAPGNMVEEEDPVKIIKKLYPLPGLQCEDL